ncbi:uncharacterized protein [Amphiura filiformis]|uniref:uncharacterized protein n=1 Tax=Amphiura filiformis TaxID=82378 RepID=UPI003B20D173
MSKFTLGPDECLVSFDVTALFTCVPVDESLVIVKDLLTADTTLESRTNLSPQQVTDLLSTCLKTTYFVYNDKFYVQREGAAMGSPVSPIIANLFMENFEEKALQSCANPPKYWGRYVDDIMVIMDNAEPLEHKLGVIRTLTHRAKTLSSDSTLLEKELDHVKKSLSICGYTKWTWSAPSSRKWDPKPRRNETPSKGHVSLPYVQGVTEAINRKIRSAGVTVHVKPSNTIRSMVVSPKDKVKTLDRTGSIYQIQCKDWPSQYIGETKRALGKRVSEHKREPSPVGGHMRSARHSFDPGEVKVLDSDSRWFQRGVKEAVYIAASEPDLNKDQGRHPLPAAYKRLLGSSGLGSLPRSRVPSSGTSSSTAPTQC